MWGSRKDSNYWQELSEGLSCYPHFKDYHVSVLFMTSGLFTSPLRTGVWTHFKQFCLQATSRTISVSSTLRPKETIFLICATTMNRLFLSPWAEFVPVISGKRFLGRAELDFMTFDGWSGHEQWPLTWRPSCPGFTPPPSSPSDQKVTSYKCHQNVIRR